MDFIDEDFPLDDVRLIEQYLRKNHKDYVSFLKRRFQEGKRNADVGGD